MCCILEVMIKLSPDHLKDILSILDGYSESKFVEARKSLAPILETYYPFDSNKVEKRLLHKLFNSWKSKKNEAIVHYWTLCKLIDKYHYQSEQIDLEVACGGMGRKALDGGISGDTHADIVVYSHPTRRPGTALITIECREYKGIDGSDQAASYSRALSSRYHLFTDSDKWNTFETQPFPTNGISVSDIPLWIGHKPLSKRLSKENILPPITDEQYLRELVKISHDRIHGEGLDPAKAFDELVKLFFVKVYDEQEVPNIYEFSVLSGESVDDTGNHIRKLLKEASKKSKYKELFLEPGDDEFYISNKSIRTVVETFQGFSFTGNSLIGIDAKGTVYENMVGSTFRGELGQYFTPRKMVEFIVDLLNPTRDDFVLDPSCGSGGFLIYTLKRVASKIRGDQKSLPAHKIETLIKEFADNNIFGTDLSPRMVRAARMNMIMHGDGWSGIVRSHGLKIKEDKKVGKFAGKFSLVLSNPPFAGFETDTDILKRFEVGRNEKGQPRGANRALVFVEEIINLLAEDGRAGLVLPRSIFENESYSFRTLRKYIFEHTEILALIKLPRTAFHHTDCGILGDLMFLKKVDKPRDQYDVFIGWADEVGYNTLGHNVDENDLPELLQNYKEHKNTKSTYINIKILKKNDNINPYFYHPKSKTIQKKLAIASNLVPLTQLATPYRSRISRKLLKETPDRMMKYLEVGAFDPETGEFKAEEHKAKELPSRATYELEGDELILLPNARNSLESRRKVILIGAGTKGHILTNRFTPLVPKVNPHYLVKMLNTDFVREQMIQACRGAGSPDLRESKLETIMIPVPNPEDLSSIDGFMERISDLISEKEEVQKNLAKVNEGIEKAVAKLLG